MPYNTSRPLADPVAEDARIERAARAEADGELWSGVSRALTILNGALLAFLVIFALVVSHVRS